MNACALQEVDVQLDEAREKLQAHAAELEEANRAMTLLRGDVQKLDAKRAHLRCLEHCEATPLSCVCAANPLWLRGSLADLKDGKVCLGKHDL
jgi:hypothetical protein